MDFGVAYLPTHDGIGPGPLAGLVEERGQSALLFAEHTHIPASRESPYPDGGPLPTGYWHNYYGDVETIWRRTLIRACEVVLGLEHRQDWPATKETPRCWPVCCWDWRC